MFRSQKIWCALAAVVSGILTSLGFPREFSLHSTTAWLIPISLVPLLVAIDRLPTTYQAPTRGHASSLRQVTPFTRGRTAFFLFWIYGAVVVSFAFFWVTVPAVHFGELPPLIAKSIFGLYCGLAGLYFPVLFSPVIWNAARCARRGTTPFPLWSLVFSVTLLELIVPRFFHWTYGNLMHGALEVAQWAAWVGSSGLTALILASQFTLSRAFSDSTRQPGRTAVLLSCTGCAWVFIFVAGHFRLRVMHSQIEQARKTNVGFVQPNFRFPGAPRDPRLSREATLQSLTSLLQLTDELVASTVGRAKLNLIVWPESTAPYDFSWSKDDQGVVKNKVKEWDAPLLVQATEFDPSEFETRGPRHATLYSTSFLMRPDGSRSPSYKKWIPIPFGETVPFEDSFPWLGDLVRENINNTSKVGRGQSYDALPFSPTDAVAPLICFDAISSELTRAQSTMGNASLYVNQANFIWMWKSNAAYEFLELGRFRAIENGRSFVLAANTGPSVALTPTGEPTALPLGLMTRGFGNAQLPILEGKTLYARVGDLPLFILGALAFVWQIFLTRPGIKKHSFFRFHNEQ